MADRFGSNRELKKRGKNSLRFCRVSCQPGCQQTDRKAPADGVGGKIHSEVDTQHSTQEYMQRPAPQHDPRILPLSEYMADAEYDLSTPPTAAVNCE